MFMNPTYRQFQPSDKEPVTEFIKSLYREDPEGLPINDAKIERTLAELTEHPDKGAIITIEYESAVVGYAILINFWSNEYGGNILHIDELYVSADYRGKGIGSKFIQYLIDNKFNNAKALQLETLPSNDKAKKLYERLGFEVSKSDHLFLDLEK